MVFPHLPQRISPCLVTFAKKVVRQYGQVMVGTERVDIGSGLSLRGADSVMWITWMPLRRRAGRSAAIRSALLPLHDYRQIDAPRVRGHPTSVVLRSGVLAIRLHHDSETGISGTRHARTRVRRCRVHEVGVR